MTTRKNDLRILIADDDADDRLLIAEAFRECKLAHPLVFVTDGEELMEHLRQLAESTDPAVPWPALILLDLNMPRKGGHEALQEIKSDQRLRRIPVVIMTTSHDEQDIFRAYDRGANSYVNKPGNFEQLVAAVEVLGKYWLETVRLPSVEAKRPDAGG